MQLKSKLDALFKKQKHDHENMDMGDMDMKMDMGDGKMDMSMMMEMPKVKNAKLFWIRSAILVAAFLYFAILNSVTPDGGIKWTWHYGIWLPITTYVVFWEGRNFLKVYPNLLRRIINMDTLIAFASHILYIYSIVMLAMHPTSPMFTYEQFWEGTGILIILTNVGYYINDRITKTSMEVYDKLEKMKNSDIILVKGRTFIKIKSSEAKIGDVILIRRGDSVPLDGIVLSAGSFDYSNITGEAKEVSLKRNDEVLSGSFNVGQNIQVRVMRTSENSTVNKIIEKIEDVAMRRPPMQRLADKILKFFVPGVIIGSMLVFLIWLALGLTGNVHLSWITGGSPVHNAIAAAVTTLAIACPCALGMATPLVYTVSSMLAAQHNIVVNNPKVLEEINRIKIIAFDKTGTLTSNEMQVAKVHGDTKLLGIASGLEAEIDHPIAKAIRAYAKPIEMTGVEYISNIGVSGKYKNKKYVIRQYVGNEFEVDNSNTCVALYANEKPLLVYELTNKVKKGAARVIKNLKLRKIKVVMITGDNEVTANAIAEKLGIDKVYAQVTPSQKAEIIAELQKEGKVAFVGDGFNDAIATKQANVSIAFDSGSSITNSLSDVSIMANRFDEIYNFIRLGRYNGNRVVASLTYAFGFNVITIPVAFILLVQPWVGAAIMAVSDILVMVNAWIYKLIGTRKLKYYDSIEEEEEKANDAQ